jgi:hypothetical protein
MPRKKNKNDHESALDKLPIGDIVSLDGELTEAEQVFLENYWPASTLMSEDEAILNALPKAGYIFQEKLTGIMIGRRIITKIEQIKDHKELMGAMGWGPAKLLSSGIKFMESTGSDMAKAQIYKLLYQAQGIAEDKDVARPTTVTMIFPGDDQEVVTGRIAKATRGRKKKGSEDDEPLTLTVKRKD